MKKNKNYLLYSLFRFLYNASLALDKLLNDRIQKNIETKEKLAKFK